MKISLKIIDNLLIIAILLVAVLIYVEVSTAPKDVELQNFYKNQYGSYMR